MLTVYNCIVNDHDLRLVLIAGLICAIASLTATSLLQHLRTARGHMRLAWISVSAISFGFGIWATHFVAMLAFAPGIPSAYNVPLTLASLVIAIVVTGGGIAIAGSRRTRDHHLVGGAIVGMGISAMHFTGMAAYEIQGRAIWDQRLVAVALCAALILGAAAFRVTLRRPSSTSNIAGALTMTLAICALHFISMAAVSFNPDSSIVISPSSVPGGWLAGAVSLAAFLILTLTGTALWVDIRDYRRSQLERGRMHDLANAAVEGLVVCNGGAIVTANDSFLKLSGYTVTDLIGANLSALLGDGAMPVAAGFSTHHVTETVLRHSRGSQLPVEAISRTIDYGGAPHTAVAIRDISERKQAEADIRRLALNDTLTGLPNRRNFTTRLDHEMKVLQIDAGKSVALLLLDLDRFKEVNDLFGHAAGDAMLQKVAQSAGRVLNDRQMLARLGGDEFAIIAPDIADPREAAELAEKILSAFEGENQVAENDGLMSTSIGIALYPSDAKDQETLVGHADTALYRAKSEGRSTYRFYEHEMGQQARSRRIMEHELRHAISRHEMHLVYQPQKKLDSGETIGFEALLRWQHPQRGNISPALFVPIAEESGAIVPIGEWVLQQACAEAVKWENSMMVAVNVSAVQLHSPHFVQTVHQVLLNTGLEPYRLELEITETALVRDMNRALIALRQLKALGIRVAMDDFGTGYSSLANLRAFPFDKIKIDGSFIRSVDTNEQAATIVKAVLGIGRGLGLPVLAEGVETSEELKFLSGELCQIGQGYYLGRPAPIDSFAKDKAGTPSLRVVSAA